MRGTTTTIAAFVALFLLAAPPVEAQTGTIAGTVTDAESGEPLPGVNVIVAGEQMGATTDGDGRYTIIGVPPGTYTMRASFVGYADQVVENVDVNIDLTTTRDFELQEETQELQEVTVEATQPVVRPDVSANVANIDVASMESVPVNSVSDLVGLQAGVEAGLEIRGGGADELSFQVNGLSMRNPRTNSPFTAIPYTALQEVQVQTGGFNAEYGNVRSGLVNVTTREGPRDRYTTDVIYRYSPPARGHLGPKPNDPQAYLMRPYVSPSDEYPNADLLAEEDVAYVGTHSDESPWDEYKRRQYPSFEGWEEISNRWAENEDLPDLSPRQVQDVFEWYRRKEFPEISDYLVDATVGGPMPLVSSYLGDLRFMASYRGEKDKFIVPQLRNADRTQTFQLTLTSNVAEGMKLSALGMYNVGEGQIGSSPYAHSANSEDMLFARTAGSLTNIYRQKYGFTFTHTLSPSTFYEISGQRNATRYEYGPGPARDYSTVNTIGGYELDEAPFGFHNEDQIVGPTGLELGGRWSVNRDSSEVTQYMASGDITSQISRFSQAKGGLEFIFTDFNSNHGIYNPAQPSVSNPKFIWHRKAMQGAAYLQDRLEFEGMIANVGLRLDYFNPRGEWYQYDTFTDRIANNTLRSEAPTEPIDGQFFVSPRLGISFPITTDSKIYFNYGHFRNTQDLQNLFDVRTAFGETTIERLGNPSFPLSQTVSYELGYDQNLFDRYLLRISGYYRAQSNQPRDVTYTGITGRVNYDIPLPLNYGDIRGLEFTLEKMRGQWFRGMVNYTYMVEKSGNFGYAQVFADAAQQLEFIRQSQLHYQSRPVPAPYANLELTFLTPPEFGPSAAGIQPLGDLRLSFVGGWRDGETFTYEGFETNLDVENNVEWVDDWNLDARFTKSINVAGAEADLFVEVNNLLDIRDCCGAGFDGSFDWEHYMRSLHLPEETFANLDEDPYLFPYGDDAPGDFREPGTDFVPIETVGSLPDEGTTRMEGEYGPLYYEKPAQEYYVWNQSAGSFEEAPEDRVDQVLEDKAYIDMPNNTSYTFLNPRDFWFGVRFSF